MQRKLKPQTAGEVNPRNAAREDDTQDPITIKISEYTYQPEDSAKVPHKFYKRKNEPLVQAFVRPELKTQQAKRNKKKMVVVDSTMQSSSDFNNKTLAGN